jgi:hypothetical protein
MTMQRVAFVLALVSNLTAVDRCVRSDTTNYVAKSLSRLKTKDQTAWRSIPWVSNLLQGSRLSQEEKYPLLVFLYSGNLKTGRC